MTFDEAVAEFDAQVGKDVGDPATFFSAETIFRKILDDRLYLDRLNSILRSVLDRTTRTNAYLTSGTFVSLCSSEASTWIVMEHRRKSHFLYMTPVNALQAPISGLGYAIDRYRLVGQQFADEVSKEAEIEFVQNEWIDRNSIMCKSGNGEIVDVLDTDPTIKTFSLRTSSRALNPFQVNFDRTTRKTFGLTPVDPMSSNLTTIFDLLADISNIDSMESLVPFAEHELHFVRWRAIRTVYAIDQKAGLDLLERACLDPHKHVRAAAIATLGTVN